MRIMTFAGVALDREVRIAPASFAQLQPQFRVARELAAGGSQFNTVIPVRLRGRLDRTALGAAVRAVLARHEALRTTFRRDGDQLLQVIRPVPDIPVLSTDLRDLAEPQRDAAITGALAAEETHHYDLENGPLVRVRLLCLASDEHLLVLTVHHIAIDGWSIPVLLADLALAYNAARAGLEPDWPPLPITYADHAMRQHATLPGRRLDRLTGYWRERLHGVADLRLPTDRLVPPNVSNHGAIRTLPLPAQTIEAARALGQAEGASLFMVLLAALGVLLAERTGQDDIPVGAFTAARSRVDTHGLVGLFANTMVLRTDLGGAPAFRELLRRVATSTRADYAHMDMPFPLLLEQLGRTPTSDHIALPRVILDVTDGGGPVGPPTFAGLTVEPIPPVIATARFDLVVAVHIAPAGGLVFMRYRTDLFEESTVDDLLAGFRRTLDRVLA